MPRGQCHRHGAERPCTCAMGNLYRFVEPVVLLLLKKHGPSYGYELATALHGHALTDAEIERAALYRTLKQLETSGHVVSEWDISGSGPARHVYRLTDSGEAHLQEWGVVVNKLSQAMTAFVMEVRDIEHSG
ncbi:MAG: lineage-specific thermal regulator protein [bacterium ADurb.Bin429]|nr:MAG: lineage-specific thermal regulator protein [bacterium ADurb.Bin429]